MRRSDGGGGKPFVDTRPEGPGPMEKLPIRGYGMTDGLAGRADAQKSPLPPCLVDFETNSHTLERTV